MNQLHADVISAINLVKYFNHDRFDMKIINHPCGTPACALGNLYKLDSALAQKLNNQDSSHWLSLFGAYLRHTIKTPLQWRDHAIAWLAKEGIDYYEHGAALQRDAGRDGVTAQWQIGADVGVRGAMGMDEYVTNPKATPTVEKPLGNQAHLSSLPCSRNDVGVGHPLVTTRFNERQASNPASPTLMDDSSTESTGSSQLNRSVLEPHKAEVVPGQSSTPFSRFMKTVLEPVEVV